MTHWKLTLAYDGTPFHGWQIQPSLPTIQGTLADALHRITGERVLPQGSGRTDAGVHALAQVASFSLAAPIPAANLHRALNRCLPPSIRVLCAEPAPATFHARHSALRKTYEYRIFPLVPDRICPPTLAPFVWPCPWPLDLDALNHAAAPVLGTHDFTSFAASDPDLASRPSSVQLELAGAPNLTSEMWVGSAGIGSPQISNLAPTPIRTITRSQWHASDSEGLLVYRVTATGFLHHMVRNLVGTFVQAGAHRLSPDAILALLSARNRTLAGPTAPPTGLFLLNVEYPVPDFDRSQLTTHN